MKKNNFVLNIHIKTYHVKYFKNFLKVFQETQQKFNLPISSISIVHMPVKKKLYTILRSPHVNKKAREQFHLKTYKMLIKISFNHLSRFLKNFLYILSLNSVGISLKIEYILK